MLDSKIDTTLYENAILSAETAIAQAGKTEPVSLYKQICDAILSKLYSTLERLGASDSVFMIVASNFIDVITQHRPTRAFR